MRPGYYDLRMKRNGPEPQKGSEASEIRLKMDGWNLLQAVVSNMFLLSPLFGEVIQFDEHIFQMGLNQRLGML